jgi:hypothetical protein
MHSQSFARHYTEDDLDAIADYYAIQARESFWAFRRFMDPDLVQGWFPRELAIKLQLFYDRLIAGRRPKLVIIAPPQHGKSRGLQDFTGWVAGKAPDIKTIYASFSSDLGTGANAAMQKMLDDPRYAIVFPNTTINKSNVVTQSSKAKRGSSSIRVTRAASATPPSTGRSPARRWGSVSSTTPSRGAPRPARRRCATRRGTG